MEVRPSRGWDDLAPIQAVCSAKLLAAPGRTNAHPGDIAWMAGWPPPHSADHFAELFLLWEHDGEVVGFAARSPDDGSLSVFVMPASSDTPDAVAFEKEALTWATHHDRPVQWVEFEDEHAAVARWQGQGFRPTDGTYMNLVQPLEASRGKEDADLRVQPVGDDDATDRASVTHAAFPHDEPFAAYARDYAAFRTTPAYPLGWDLLLRDDEDRAAACCIAWIDPVSRAGTFEPVAVHPDLHGRGFGTALLTEGLRRFAAAGMTWAIVGVVVGNRPAEALYRSVGFQPDRLLRVYERP